MEGRIYARTRALEQKDNNPNKKIKTAGVAAP
jgi:hypothetical protein